MLVKTWKENRDFVNTLISFFNNNQCFFVVTNFLFAFSMFLVIEVKRYFLGEMATSEKKAALDYFGGFFSNCFLMFYNLGTFEKDFSLIYLVVMMCLGYASFAIRVKVDGIMMKELSIESNRRLFVFQVLIFVIGYYFTMRLIYLYKNNSGGYFISSACRTFISLMVELIIDIIKHVLILYDSITGMNSRNFASKLLIEIVSKFIQLALSFIVTGPISKMNNSDEIFYLLKIFELLPKFSKYYQTRKLHDVIRSNLREPTEELIQSQEVCVICRNALTMKDSKVLPCNHCCHVDCILQWVDEQPKCPLCGYDLKELLKKKVEPPVNEDNDDNNIENEDDKIFKYEDLVIDNHQDTDEQNQKPLDDINENQSYNYEEVSGIENENDSNQFEQEQNIKTDIYGQNNFEDLKEFIKYHQQLINVLVEENKLLREHIDLLEKEKLLSSEQ